MPMFLFFLNIVIYPRVLTMSQFVSKYLKISQNVSICTFEQFCASLSNFELIWAQQNLINFEQS